MCTCGTGRANWPGPSLFPNRASPMALRSRTSTLAIALTLGAASCARGGTQPATDDTSAGGELPRTHAPRPTSTAISAADLMTRLYIFSDDSMEGRRAGSPGSARANAYIERELRRLGLQPAGENGYYQDVPLVTRAYDATAALTVEGGATLKYGSDFLPTIGRGTPRALEGAPVIYGGAFGDDSSLTPEQVSGKLVIFTRS